MMTTAAVIGLSAGKRLLSSSYYYSDLTDKLSYVNDHALAHNQITSTKKVISSKKSSNYSPSFTSSNRQTQSIKAVKEHVNITSSPSAEEPWDQRHTSLEEESSDLNYSVEALLLLQKSMLEKQWNLSFERTVITDSPRGRILKKIPVTCSGVSARERRMTTRKKNLNKNGYMMQPCTSKQMRSMISPELLQNRSKGYVKGVLSEYSFTHSDVVCLSKKIKTGISLEEHKLRLKERLGCEPSDDQLATALRIPRAELQSKLIECTLAREKLAMGNIRLVMSIAQRYENMGAEMADLVQGGLIGLLRGIEKFDSSKGYKISTYVYWWIRQGVSRALVENSRTLRLPTHLHERLGLIKNAKIKLQEKGITPSIDRIAECLNMSKKKVKNATEALASAKPALYHLSSQASTVTLSSAISVACARFRLFTSTSLSSISPSFMSISISFCSASAQALLATCILSSASFAALPLSLVVALATYFSAFSLSASSATSFSQSSII